MTTRDARASAIGWGLACLVVLPAPDGALDQGDRQQVAGAYRGVLAIPLQVAPYLPVTLSGHRLVPTVTLDGHALVSPLTVSGHALEPTD